MGDDNNSIVILAVGDKGCGKASLMQALSPFECENLLETSPTSEDITINLEGEKVTLELHTISGLEDEDELRKGMLIHTDIVLLCYAIDDPDSLKSIKSKWLPEIQEVFPNAPYILVGNKRDLRNLPQTFKKLAEKNQKPVKMMEAECLAMQIRAYAFVECSYTLNDGLLSVFRTAARAALDMKAYNNYYEVHYICGDIQLHLSPQYTPMMYLNQPQGQYDYNEMSGGVNYQSNMSPAGGYVAMNDMPSIRGSILEFYHQGQSLEQSVAPFIAHSPYEAYYNHEEMQPQYCQQMQPMREAYQAEGFQNFMNQYRRPFYQQRFRRRQRKYFNNDIDDCNLYINNLPYDMNEESLIKIFAPFGHIDSVKVVCYPDTDKCMGYGFVRYDNPCSALNAIENMNGFKIGYKELFVELKRKKNSTRFNK